MRQHCGSSFIVGIRFHMGAQSLLRHSGRLTFGFVFLTATFLTPPSTCAQTPAIDSLRQALSAHEHDTVGITILIALGTELSRSNLEQSRAYLYRGIATSRRLKTTFGLSAFYSHLTTSYQNAAEPDSARKYLSLLKEVAELTNVKNSWINYYTTAGLYYKNLSQFETAIGHMLTALSLMDPERHTVNYAGQLLNIGNAYAHAGDINKAAHYHLQALGRFEALNNKRGESFCYQSLGNSYLKLKRYNESLDYFARSLRVKQELNDERGMVSAWNGMGNVFLETRQYDKALAHFDKALISARSRDLRIEELRSLFDMGLVHARMKNPGEAKEVFTHALSLAQQRGDSLLTAKIRSELTKLDATTLRPSQVVDDLEKKIGTARRAGDLNGVSYGYLDLARHYARYEDFGKAYDYLEKHHQLNDSLAGMEITVRFREMEQRYQAEKREKEIALLTKDRALTQAIIASQSANQNIILVALGATVILSVFAIRYFQLRSRAKRKDELDRVRNGIARDLHDDIGSALSSIHILSQIALKDSVNIPAHLQKISEGSFKMMEGMSDIVWSINPDNESVERMLTRMKEFAAEILESANISYRFVVKGEIERISLDAEKRKNVFLIYKESLNNAVKYSGATAVIIELGVDKGMLSMRVIDNGKGFDVSTVRLGNGLNNMKARAAGVNGQLRLSSVPGNGTELIAKVPIT